MSANHPSAGRLDGHRLASAQAQHAADKAEPQDEQFRAEVKKRNYEFDPVGGEELEKLAKDVTSQPPDVVARAAG